jgi:hypothetical protein
VPACPPLYVEAPATTPYSFGLFSVASFPVEADDHWRCGIEYEPQACGAASAWGDPCDAAQADKAGVDGVDLVEGDPFTVYAGITCRLPGRTDFEDRARAALALGEQRAVEEAYWTGSAGNTPRLADPAADILNTVAGAPGALCPAAAIASLEAHLASNYGGAGIIHAPRYAVPFLSRNALINPGRDRITTDLGTAVAAGGGYAVNTGPDGAAAPADTVWLYATGAVVIRRSEVWVNPDTLAQSLDRAANQIELLAERTYVVTHECVLAAVLMSVTC